VARDRLPAALAIVEKQLSEAAQLLLVPDECDGAVGRAIEIRRLQQRASDRVARARECRVAWEAALLRQPGLRDTRDHRERVRGREPDGGDGIPTW
jgi:hypothetical protein